ncbi:hypothetical protein DSCO28_45010 [Desulfosarcina ovata subsp. sediminis]|uniref:Uncharacterized protein n=1 Tax=Desulfosarcina ovata subsp. sediminis TaxID=885957 RepID=A0A5K7ZUM4_9BACT|nr:hypothetical protein [Desulfosarcina ovata]BBO83935.1 hypothetical protein DSCO28_45010 [Desulfosarcina ovata subsp. sediminis]
MMQHIPPDDANRHHPNVIILDFISSNRTPNFTGRADEFEKLLKDTKVEFNVSFKKCQGPPGPV